MTFLQVNPVREKKLTNIRTTAADEKVFLQPPRKMTLEDAIGVCMPQHAGVVRFLVHCPAQMSTHSLHRVRQRG